MTHRSNILLMTMVALPKPSNILTKQTTNFKVKVEKNKSHMNDACDYTKNETIVIERKAISKHLYQSSKEDLLF